jgi:superfamily I DNA/RNA helicase
MCRSKNLTDTEGYSAALANAGIRTYEIKRSKTDDRNMPGVRLATMHRVKGLEFTNMFIVGMNKNAMPMKFCDCYK